VSLLDAQRNWWVASGAPLPDTIYFDDTYFAVTPERLPTLAETRDQIATWLQLMPQLRLHWSQLGVELVWPRGLGAPDQNTWIPQHFPEWQRRLVKYRHAPRGAKLVRLRVKSADSGAKGHPVLILSCHRTACLNQEAPPNLTDSLLVRVPYCMHMDRRTTQALLRAFGRPRFAEPLGFAVDPQTCR